MENKARNKLKQKKIDEEDSNYHPNSSESDVEDAEKNVIV